MSRRLLFNVALLTLGSTLNVAQCQRQRIAVMIFDVGQDVQANASRQFGMNDLGRNLSDMLLQKLFTDGKFDVVERTKLDTVISENHTSNSSNFDPNTAAKIGKLAGANAIVIASVTQYGGEVKDTSVNVSSVPGLSALKDVGKLHQHSSQVSVKINARLVDTNTGNVLAVASGDGEAQASKTDVKATSGIYKTTSKDFPGTTVGKATNQAIDAIAASLEQPSGANSSVAAVSGPQAAPSAPQAGPAASLTVEASVAGADIEVDGAFAGSTPSTISVPPGQHTISVKKKGYAVWTRALNVSGNGVKLIADLEAAPK